MKKHFSTFTEIIKGEFSCSDIYTGLVKVYTIMWPWVLVQKQDKIHMELKPVCVLTTSKRRKFDVTNHCRGIVS